MTAFTRTPRGDPGPPPAPDPWGVQLIYDPQVRPKARLEGSAAAVARAERWLRPHLGPAGRFAAGRGWNLNREAARRAQALLLARGEPPARLDASRCRTRILIPVGEAAPPVLERAAGALRFDGWGRPFTLGRRQAQVAGGAAIPASGAKVRFAYYADPSTTRTSGRSRSRPQP